MGEGKFAEKNEAALVTGAGHRLGRDIALELARLGYTILIHYHQSRDAAEETKSEVESLGVNAYTVQADLTHEAQVEDLFATVNNVKVPLTVFVHSAAIMVRATIDDISTEVWDRTMDLNLRSAWLCSRRANAGMQEQGGSIIHISDSGAGRLWLTYPAYSISKAGIDILTRMMAKDYAPKVRVNAVAPGLIMPPDTFPQDTWDRLIQRLPLKRPGTTGEICSAIRFLLENEYITGQSIVVDGGYQLV